MGATMDGSDISRKGPAFGIVQGEKWGERKSWAERSGCKRPALHVPGLWLGVLDRVVQQAADHVRTERGSPSKMWHRLTPAVAESHAFHTEARRVIEAAAAGVADEKIQAFADSLACWTERYLASKRQTRMADGMYSNEPNSPRAA